MTATINVNLKPCDSPCEHYRPRPASGRGEHCAAAPVLLPCHIPPSVDLTVTLVTCGDHPACIGSQHAIACPARSVRVLCSIGGKAWPDSTPIAFEVVDRPNRAFMNDAEADAAIAACRKLWEIVKALLLGKPLSLIPGIPPGALPLVQQRDVMFAALAELASHEEAARKVQKSMPMPPRAARHGWGHCCPRDSTPAAWILFGFVQHLIHEIGSMS